ncbi:MAG TPA: sugar phosphate isomerase/epimerase [Anaerolineales bacterium]
MKISTATSVFVNYSLNDAVDAVIEAGFAGIDLWCGRPHLYRHDHSPAALEGIRRKLEDAGVTPVSLMPAFFRYPYSLTSPNDVVRQDSIDYVKDCIDNALLLGSSQVLIVPTHSLNGQPVEDTRRRFLESLKCLCEYAEPVGMKLGIEMVYPRLSDVLSSSAEALSIMQTLGYSGLGVVLDSGHIHLSGEDLEQALSALGSSLLQVHVNDNDGQTQQNAIPGEGSFDFDRLIHLLARNGYDGFLTLELGWNYSFDPLPAVSRAKDRVQGYLNGTAG